MRVSELNSQQLIELKQNYLTQLDNEGTLEEVAGIKSLGWSDLANANSIVSDNVIFENYENTDFSPNDFSCGDNTPKCPRCGVKLERETDTNLKREYKYFCPKCDENYYAFETSE